MTDSRKNTITAKVAAQIVEFYNTSQKNLDTCNSLELFSTKRYKVGLSVYCKIVKGTILRCIIHFKICWLRVREVTSSIPSQGPRLTKDIIKMVPVVPSRSTLKREILAL